MKWISIKDGLPDYDENILARVDAGLINKKCLIMEVTYTVLGFQFAFLYGKFFGDEFLGRDIHRFITHWMPLPEPPKGGGR